MEKEKLKPCPFCGKFEEHDFEGCDSTDSGGYLLEKKPVRPTIWSNQDFITRLLEKYKKLEKRVADLENKNALYEKGR